jgi:uncharacterized cupin superfamily protein
VSSDPNIYAAKFDELREHEGFRSRRARLGRQAGSERVGLSLWELRPGEAAYPYHYHFAQEEIVIALSGRPSLRTPDGWRELDEGAVVSFPVGEAGAHQLVNRTGTPIRILALSNQQPDVVVRPDSGTLTVAECRPAGGGLLEHFRRADAVGYTEGETA